MSNEPIYEDLVWESIVEHEEPEQVQIDRAIDDHLDRGRTCGCPDDYHLADCPIRTGGYETRSDEWDPYGDEE